MWWKQVPNAITLSRFPLGALFVVLHSYGHVHAGAVCATLMCLSDGADGYFARKWGCTSEFGARVEPFADRWAYGTIVIVTVSLIELLPLLYPAMALIVLYEALALVAWAILRQRDVRTNWYGKLRTACVMSMGLVLYVGAISGFTPHVLPLAVILGYGAAYCTVGSIVVYVRERGYDAWIPRPLHLL